MWVHLFIMFPLQTEAFTCLYRRCWFLCKRTNTTCITVAAFCANGLAASVVPFVERGSDTTVGSWRELGGPSTSRLEQPHKQERHHTLTQNLKAMNLWVLLLIRCLTFTFLSDVGHITHTCTQHSDFGGEHDELMDSHLRGSVLYKCELYVPQQIY